MPKTNANLFCFFSGFTHQDIEVFEYQEDLNLKTLISTCHNRGHHKLSQFDYIQLDGVLFQVIETWDSYFKASSTFELLNNTSLQYVKLGSKLALGILAEKDLSHDCLWMLQPSASNQVTYLNYSILDGKEHTLKLDFEAPIELKDIIKENNHLGLAGSSLTVRDVSISNPLIHFSIYCGRATRENSQFNQSLESGILINVTEPSEIEMRTNKSI